MKTITVANYRKDKYYPRVVCAVANILYRSNVVAPVDVLREMGNLTKQNYEAWRRGKVPNHVSPSSRYQLDGYFDWTAWSGSREPSVWCRPWRCSSTQTP